MCFCLSHRPAQVADVPLSRSEDGSILQFDLRTGGVTGCLNEASEFNSVAYHPLTPENFASSDAQGRLLLHDARMAFSDGGGLASEVAVVHVRPFFLAPKWHSLII